MQDPESVERRALSSPNSQLEAKQVASSPSTIKSPPTVEKLIPWQDGEDYDSDEYEVVEIEVTESEGSEAEQRKYDSPPTIQAPLYDRYTPSENPSNRFDTPSLLTSSDELKALSPPSSSQRTYLKEDPSIALNRLQISDQHPSRDFHQTLIPRTKKRNFSPASPTSSTRSLSPATPRPVKEDDSWITGTPFHRLGAK